MTQIAEMRAMSSLSGLICLDSLGSFRYFFVFWNEMVFVINTKE